MRDHSIMLIPVLGVIDGKKGDAVQIAPPYIITSAEVELFVQRLEATIKQVLG